MKDADFLLDLKVGATKTQIIGMLVSEGFLDLDIIYQKLKLNNPQLLKNTIYSQLLELQNKGVVERKDKKYGLSSRWLKKIYGFCHEATQKHFLSEPENICQNRLLCKAYTFEMLKDFDTFLLDFEKKIIAQLTGKHIFIWNGQHAWWNLFYLQRERELLRLYKTKGIELYTLLSGNTPLDRWNVKVYQQLGMKAKCGSLELFSSNIGIYNNHVLFLLLPLDLQTAFNELFESVKSFDDANLDVFFNLLEKKYESMIHLFIYEDALLAEKLKNQVLSQFKER